jgi:transcriptional regulator with XRE-family HTH domain
MSGDELAQLRARRSWTQKQLAAEIGVSAALVSKWERRYEGNVPAYWGSRAREVLTGDKGPPNRDEAAKAAVVSALRQSPGKALSALYLMVDNTKATRRAITALEREGTIVRSDSWDGVGRRFPGYYLPSQVPAPGPFLTGAEIRARRVRAGLTASEAGESIGVRGNTVTRWETGARSCPPRQLEALVELLSGGSPDGGRPES